jgi:hypothetical protein
LNEELRRETDEEHFMKFSSYIETETVNKSHRSVEEIKNTRKYNCNGDKTDKQRRLVQKPEKFINRWKDHVEELHVQQRSQIKPEGLYSKGSERG